MVNCVIRFVVDLAIACALNCVNICVVVYVGGCVIRTVKKFDHLHWRACACTQQCDHAYANVNFENCAKMLAVKNTAAGTYKDMSLSRRRVADFGRVSILRLVLALSFASGESMMQKESHAASATKGACH